MPQLPPLSPILQAPYAKPTEDAQLHTPGFDPRLFGVVERAVWRCFTGTSASTRERVLEITRSVYDALVSPSVQNIYGAYWTGEDRYKVLSAITDYLLLPPRMLPPAGPRP